MAQRHAAPVEARYHRQRMVAAVLGIAGLVCIVAGIIGGVTFDDGALATESPRAFDMILGPIVISVLGWLLLIAGIVVAVVAHRSLHRLERG